MEPRVVTIDGRELGNAAAAGELAGISWETFTWYARRDRKRRAAIPLGEPIPLSLCPWRVRRDDETGQSLWDLEEVRRWTENRPGRGMWAGIGVDRRRNPDDVSGGASPAGGPVAAPVAV